MSALHNTTTLVTLPRVQAPVQLTASLWPDCMICGHDVNTCRCDPEDYAKGLRLRGRGGRA